MDINNPNAIRLDRGCIVTYFLSISATVKMNTNLDPVGTAVPGEIIRREILFTYEPAKV